jgi:hypothetical protein
MNPRLVEKLNSPQKPPKREQSPSSRRATGTGPLQCVTAQGIERVEAALALQKAETAEMERRLNQAYQPHSG